MPVAPTTLQPVNTASNNTMLRKRKPKSPLTFDSDFWIDLSLVALLGGLSFVALKVVECVILTDAIVGLY
ncbi:MAG: hypothetical protein HC795_01690 [Coleofasciculaceae cyanobacterium RL_1_1]|nr:hypothetical protein [Coleofasciculaceae cyanobacterium RL_1_1]